jgi:hypothetical protein
MKSAKITIEMDAAEAADKGIRSGRCGMCDEPVVIVNHKRAYARHVTRNPGCPLSPSNDPALDFMVTQVVEGFGRRHL